MDRCCDPRARKCFFTTQPRPFLIPGVPKIDEVLQTFVYPDSRAQFLDALRNIQGDLGEDAEKFLSSHQTEFWSYTFLNSGALASSVSMPVKERKRTEQPPTIEIVDASP